MDDSKLESNNMSLNIKTTKDDKLLILDNISKGFNVSGNYFDVLKNINYEINTADTIAVVGESGIGKSTLLHIIGTLDEPDTGNLIFQGENIFLLDKKKISRIRNRYIGFVFQFHHLLHEFTALENVMMPLLIRNVNRTEAFEAVEKMLIKVGLKDRLLHRIGELSGGEQQRVAIARAIVQNPFLLLADEPTGNLDKKTSKKIHELLLELNNEFNMTMLVVTHNSELASLMSKKIILVDGKLEETE